MSETEGRQVMVQGRVVWTSGKTIFEGKVKLDQHTKQPRINKKGEPMVEFGCGLAVQKVLMNQCAPGQPGEIWAAIHEEAYKLYPSRQLPPGFAWKYKDGDGVDHNGQPFNQREGHAEHLIFALVTSIPIKFFRFENGQNVMINEGIKCGDYVQAAVTVKAHGAEGQGKAGLYLNPNAIRFLGYGTEIINAPSGDQIFGSAMPAMPPGASATPLAPIGAMPGQPPMPGMPGPQGGFAPPPQPAYQQPPAAPAPHYAVLPPVHQPPPGGMPIGYPQPGNVQSPAGYPAPAAAATPLGAPMPQSFAAPANPAWGQPPGYPGAPR